MVVVVVFIINIGLHLVPHFTMERYGSRPLSKQTAPYIKAPSKNFNQINSQQRPAFDYIRMKSATETGRNKSRNALPTELL